MDADVLVVGGGLLGMCVASIAIRDVNRGVLVCRLSDSKAPHADSLRNQSWLQSGLRYFSADDFGEKFVFARRMQVARRLLHDEVGIPLPDGFGVQRMRNQDDADEFEARAKQFGVRVERLTEAASLELIGETFFVPGSPYYATPETTFDEPAILEELRARVMANGAICEIAQPATLVANRDSPSGLELVVGSLHVRAPTVILAAGAGNIPLLQDLGLSAELEIEQTPLLVIPDGNVMPKARVFVDRVRKCSVVSHPPSEAMPHGSMVIGVEGTSETVPFSPPSERRIRADACEGLWKKLPPALRTSHEKRSRVTAGFEVKRPHSPSTSIPWISDDFEAFPGLIAAIPGRATLSMDVAQLISERVRARSAHDVSSLTAPAWSGPIYMHHAPFYDHLDDREPSGS